MSSIFESFLSTAEVQEAFGDRAFVAAMLRFEAALARAQADAGLIPEAAAQSIIGTCKVELFDVAKIVRESPRAGSLAIPLVESLKETVGLFNPAAVDHAQRAGRLPELRSHVGAEGLQQRMHLCDRLVDLAPQRAASQQIEDEAGVHVLGLAQGDVVEHRQRQRQARALERPGDAGPIDRLR